MLMVDKLAVLISFGNVGILSPTAASMSAIDLFFITYGYVNFTNLRMRPWRFCPSFDVC